jgi:hypothetical protein
LTTTKRQITGKHRRRKHNNIEVKKKQKKDGEKYAKNGITKNYITQEH